MFLSPHAARSWCLALAAVLTLAAPAGAQDPAPDVSLDDLLKLPSSVDYEAEKRGGAGMDEWRRRFQTARMELRQAKAELSRSLEELDAQGESPSWQMAPPGLGQVMQQQNQNQQTGGQGSIPGQQANPAPSPMGLSGEIKRQKAEVQRAERALRDLEVEANLAGVPESWRK